MEYKNILFEIKDKICKITINRPDKLNALNKATLDELGYAFESLAVNDAVRGVLLTGSGPKAFVAGADISEINSLDLRSGRSFARFGQEIFNRIEQSTKPVIALVNGFALGGGCELAMACHIRLAAEKARFGQPEINLGLIPGYGGTQRLARIIGQGPALELLLTGKMISAQKALEMGLVNNIFPAEELETEGRKLLKAVTEKSPLTTAYILRSVIRGTGLELGPALELEADYFGMACQSDDMKEGTSAFLEKREPQFKGK